MQSFSDSREPMFKDGSRHEAKRKIWLYGIVLVIVGFTIGILIGRFATCPKSDTESKKDGTFLPGVPESIIQDGDPKISGDLINGIKAENIRQYLR